MDAHYGWDCKLLLLCILEKVQDVIPNDNACFSAKNTLSHCDGILGQLGSPSDVVERRIGAVLIFGLRSLKV